MIFSPLKSMLYKPKWLEIKKCTLILPGRAYGSPQLNLNSLLSIYFGSSKNCKWYVCFYNTKKYIVMKNSFTRNKTFWTVFLNTNNKDALSLAATEL